MFWFLFCWLESHNHFTLVVKPKATLFRSSRPKVFLGKDVLKICSKFTGEHSCWSAISIKLLSNFIKIAIRHECSPVNLMHIFRTPFYKNTSGWCFTFHHYDHLSALGFCMFSIFGEDSHKQKCQTKGQWLKLVYIKLFVIAVFQLFT